MSDHWTAADGRLLKSLREDAVQDRASLARSCTLSTAQLAELEDGGHGRFYSERIKVHTGRSVLRRLGHHAPAAPTGAFESKPAPVRILPPESKVSLPSRAPERRRARLMVTTGVVVAVTSATAIALLPAVPDPSRKPANGTLEAAAPSAIVPPAAAIEPASVAPEPAIPAELAVASTPARPAEANPGRCDWAPPADTLARYTPPTAHRPDNYVYMEAVLAASVCVIDGQNRQTLAVVKPGDAVTIHGTAPFTVQTRQWNDLRVFFQGIRVHLESAVAPQAVVLNAR